MRVNVPISSPSLTTTAARDGRPPASDTVIEFVGLLAIAIAIGAVYVGARRTRQDRPGDANAAPTDPRPQSKKRRR